MTDAKSVIFAFCPPGKGRQSTGFLDRGDCLFTAGQNFVGVGLVTHIPDNPVNRSVIEVVQCDGQLYTAEPGSKLPATACDSIHQIIS